MATKSIQIECVCGRDHICFGPAGFTCDCGAVHSVGNPRKVMSLAAGCDHDWRELNSRPVEQCRKCRKERLPQYEPPAPEGPKVTVHKEKVSDFDTNNAREVLKKEFDREWGMVAHRVGPLVTYEDYKKAAFETHLAIVERLTVQVPVNQGVPEDYEKRLQEAYGDAFRAPPSSMGAPLTKSALECFIPDPSKPAEPRTEGDAISLNQLDWLLDQVPGKEAGPIIPLSKAAHEALRDLAKKVDQERTKEKSTDHLRGKDILKALW